MAGYRLMLAKQLEVLADTRDHFVAVAEGRDVMTADAARRLAESCDALCTEGERLLSLMALSGFGEAAPHMPPRAVM